MDKPLVSILCPAYNCEAYIAEAIVSIQAQTYTNWEMIIIDDGSPDNLGNVARKYAERDGRIRVSRIPHGGHAIALNAAWSKARGELIGRQDADDWSEPARFERQIDELLSQEADLVSCLMARYRKGRSGKKTLGRDVGGSGCVPRDFCTMSNTKGPASATIISRRKVWEKVGPFDTIAAGHEVGSTDSDWIFRVLMVDNPPLKWAHVHDELYCYRDHPGQCTKTHALLGVDDHELFRAKYGPAILARLDREAGVLA